MAILRASQVREKSDEELEADVGELKKTLMKIRGGVASGGIPEDVGKTREIKKTIARILTIKRERELGLPAGRKNAPAAKPDAVTEPAVENKPEKKDRQDDNDKPKIKGKKKQKEVIKKNELS
jgi:large subunit ribosomal protein L29